MALVKPQVIIPMSGVGKRFVDAGYYHLKPLINVGSSRIINEVMNMFPDIDDPLFIISKDHKQNLELFSYLKECWPNSKISQINSHKLGPGHAIFESKEYIDENRPAIVSYCDFSGNWNFENFCKELSVVDSLILTYTGFHPHMLRNTKYAYVQKNLAGFVTMIQEKNSFTDFPMQEEASAGLYAFSSGNLLIEALREQISQNYSHMGEYYISLTILPLLAKNLKIKTYLMDSFSQFGTPEDLKDWEYLYRSINHFRINTESINILSENVIRDESSIILAGGIGSRLSDFSQVPKPFIEVNGKQLWRYSKEAGSKSHKFLVIRKEFIGYIKEEDYIDTKIVVLEKPTQGQADTARYALNNIDELSGPITFFSCDNYVDQKDYNNAINLLNESDLVVWTAVGYPMASYKPNRYSWVNIENNTVTGFSLKNLPVNFKNPGMIVGNFTFKDKKTAIKLLDECFKIAERYSSEIYLDSVIQIALEYGYKVSTINLENFFAVGTEDELNTFRYFANLKKLNKF